MGRTIMASLAYIGRNVPWLAKQLGVSKNYVYDRLKDDDWRLSELRLMKELFRWESLEG